MPKSRITTKLIGFLIGTVLIVAAVYSIFFVEWKTELPPEPPIIRPLKTMIIESPYTWIGRKYPGKVKAGTSVMLSFDVAGAIIEKLVSKGDEVKEGQLLFRLDPRDFQNALDAAKAEQERAKAQYERIKVAASTGAVSQQELTNAQAAFDVAKAQVKINEKALEDTSLRAKFSGLIANTFADNFQHVQAKQSILSLQDVSSVEIDVNLPEDRVALSMKDRENYRLVATFDYLPDNKFEVTLKSFSTEADPVTQTFRATLAMPAPKDKDITILPGMTATVTPYRLSSEETEGNGYAIPLDLVLVDGLGNYYVWKVKQSGEDQWAVQRVDVKVGEMVDSNDILVLEGISKGDRIAAAGVHLLENGQVVRLLSPQTEEADG
jgi:RND family efflux transporter MFP subunit